MGSRVIQAQRLPFLVASLAMLPVAGGITGCIPVDADLNVWPWTIFERGDPGIAENWSGAAGGSADPYVVEITAEPSGSVSPGTQVTLTASVKGASDTAFDYGWRDDKTVIGTSSTLEWTAPSTEGTYVLACVAVAEDGQGESSIIIVVRSAIRAARPSPLRVQVAQGLRPPAPQDMHQVTAEGLRWSL